MHSYDNLMHNPTPLQAANAAKERGHHKVSEGHHKAINANQ
jgi:hypothetical protein